MTVLLWIGEVFGCWLMLIAALVGLGWLLHVVRTGEWIRPVSWFRREQVRQAARFARDHLDEGRPVTFRGFHREVGIAEFLDGGGTARRGPCQLRIEDSDGEPDVVVQRT